MAISSDRRVLIVDDDSDAAESLAELLQTHGCATRTITKPERAEQALLDFDPHLAMVDLRLGLQSGFELIAAFKMSRPKLVCVMLTAFADVETVIEALRLGVDDFLRKPAAPAELLAVYERSFERLHLRAERDSAERALHEAHDELERRVEARTTELSLAREQLRALSSKLLAAQEEERRRIASAVHDELGQYLTALKLNLATAAQHSKEALAQERLRRMDALLDGTIATVKRLSATLRPAVLEDLGIVEALEWRVSEFERHAEIPCQLDVKPKGLSLGRERSLAVYRIVQEALTNVARHASAKRVGVSLERSRDGVRLEVRDDGRGIPRKRITGVHSLGLVGMREQVRHCGGAFSIEGRRGRGTVIRVEFPPTGQAAGAGATKGG